MKFLLKALGIAVVLLVVLVSVLLASAWAPDRPVESLKARWAPAPSQFVRIDGMDVHLRDEGPRGDPQPIVLLHGTSASLHTWDGWVDTLKDKHRVVRVDLPGFGLTGPPPDGDYTRERYSRFMMALFEQLKIGQAVVAGNSFGGAVAWKFAFDHPERVAKLILVDAGGYRAQAQSVPLAFTLARRPSLAPLMRNLLARRVVESSVRNVYGDPSRVTPELVDRYYELALREGNRQALAERFRAVPNEDHSSEIRKLRQPTLILWGAEDRLIPPVLAQRFAKDVAASRLQMFDGLGHVPHEEDPARSVAPVLDFLAQK